MKNLEQLREDLEKRFPEYSFSYQKRFLQEQCLNARSSGIYGADIYLKRYEIRVVPVIPDKKLRILLGSGVLLLIAFSKKFKEPSVEDIQVSGRDLSKYGSQNLILAGALNF